jgi:hypothetical protein
MLRRVALAIIGIALVAGLAACGPLIKKGTLAAEGSAPSATAAVTRHNLGDTVDVAGLQIQVNGAVKLPVTATDKPGNTGLSPIAGAQKVPATGADKQTFVAVDVTVSNGSSKAQEIGALVQFSLKDAQGHLTHPTIHSKAKNPPEEQLAPGAKTSGQLVYLVPEDAKGLQLTYDASPLGGGQEIWAIGDAAQIR